MTTIGYVNLSLELWGCVMCGVVMLCLFLGRRRHSTCDRLYMQMLLCNIGALLFDALALLLRGHPGSVFWWGVRIANFIAFLMNYGLLASFVEYLTEYLAQYAKVPRMPMHIAQGLCMTGMLLVVLTQFFPLFYRIDARNIYHRADFFWVSHVLGILVLAVCAWLLLYCSASVAPQQKVCLWSYIVLPFAAVIVQMFIYGLALVNLANTISIVIIFLFLQAEQNRLAAERENLLTQSRVSIMLSQIQPHFLYNTLATIQAMCRGKAPEAEQATVQFAQFLRGNLDSLQASAPIPFEKELHHTQNYLWLEKQRFQGFLQVRYDIHTMDFLIPALTLQPIVENAVRYGVMKKENGGTVWISTQETEHAYTVTVKDDGMGFDAYAPKSDGRTHIGISNVGERLRMMCGGSLNITSTLGQGTVAVISVPKEN